MYDYDVIYLGSGHAAWHGGVTLAAAGKKVAVRQRSRDADRLPHPRHRHEADGRGSQTHDLRLPHPDLYARQPADPRSCPSPRVRAGIRSIKNR